MPHGLELRVRDDVEVLGHHLEQAGELGEAAAEIHLALKLLEDVLVVEEGVGKEAVKATDD